MTDHRESETYFDMKDGISGIRDRDAEPWSS